MGASYSLADDPDFKTIKGDVADIKATISDYAKLKTQVANVGKAAAGSINLGDLAKELSDSSVYSSKIADNISQSPGKLGDSLNEQISKNQVFIDKIGQLLQDNTTFSNTMAQILTDPSKPFKNKIKGEKGDSGELSSSVAAVKDNLYGKKYTVWCADGDVCQLPAGSKGFTSGEDIILKPKSKVNVVGGLNVGGSMVMDGATISNTGRMHIAGGENLFILNKNGVIIGKEWGGNGNLSVQGDAGVGGTLNTGQLQIGDWFISVAGADFRIHKGDVNNPFFTLGTNRGVYASGRQL